MKDLRNNKTGKIYVIIEETYKNDCVTVNTYVFDDEKRAKKQFKKMVDNHTYFLSETGIDDYVWEDEESYFAYPYNQYSKFHYSINLHSTKK